MSTTITAQDELDEAVVRLYEVFAHYPLDPIVFGCLHCVSVEDNSRIHSKPLRELEGEDLGRFAFKALTTWGHKDDFRHFLPRIFELWSQNAIMLVLPDILIRKLELAEWLDWPDEEQEAVERFLESLWKANLTSYPSSLEVPDLLLTMGSYKNGNVDPYLEYWREELAKNEAALRHLLDFVDTIQYYIGRVHYKWQGEEWGRWEPIEHWLSDSALSDTLETLFFRYADMPLGDEVSKAVRILAQFRAALSGAAAH
jgi:hypothetical protein